MNIIERQAEHITKTYNTDRGCKFSYLTYCNHVQSGDIPTTHGFFVFGIASRAVTPLSHVKRHQRTDQNAFQFTGGKVAGLAQNDYIMFVDDSLQGMLSCVMHLLWQHRGQNGTIKKEVTLF